MEGHEVRCAEEASSEDVAEPSDGVRVVQLLLEEHHGDPRHAAGADAHQYGPCVHQSCTCVVQDNVICKCQTFIYTSY